MLVFRGVLHDFFGLFKILKIWLVLIVEWSQLGKFKKSLEKHVPNQVDDEHWTITRGSEIIPGSSKCVKFVPFHLQKPTKRQQFYISGRSRYEIQQLYLGSLDLFDFLFAPLVAVGGWLDLSEVVVGPKAVVEKAVELGPGGENPFRKSDRAMGGEGEESWESWVLAGSSHDLDTWLMACCL